MLMGFEPTTSNIFFRRYDHSAIGAGDTKQKQNFGENISVHHSQVGVRPSWPMLPDVTTRFYRFMDNP